jgi:hypothetical protein
MVNVLDNSSHYHCVGEASIYKQQNRWYHSLVTLFHTNMFQLVKIFKPLQEVMVMELCA